MAVQVDEVHLEAVEGVDERHRDVRVEVVSSALEFGMRPRLKIDGWLPQYFELYLKFNIYVF